MSLHHAATLFFLGIIVLVVQIARHSPTPRIRDALRGPTRDL